MKQKKPSPAMHLLQLVWSNANSQNGHSWERLNHSMADALRLAIASGMPFAEGDFASMSAFRHGYWLHPEQMYALAIVSGNASAIKSMETAWSRKPIIADNVEAWHPSGQKHRYTFASHRCRLAVGFSFTYGDVRPVVTSFTDDGTAVIACTYKDSSKSTIARRYRLTSADIIRDRAERKATKGTSTIKEH